MLRELRIENYAIIEALDIRFDRGLNTITGETGAGKSILLGAIGLLSGAKAEAGCAANGQANCVVEAAFEIDGYGLEPFFAENDLDYQPVVTIRRVVGAGGKSRAYIDDLPVTLGLLKELSERLIDIHSQHQTLLLGAAHFQTHLIDTVAGQTAAVADYALRYKRLTGLRSELARAEQQAAEALKERDYLQHQFDQISALRLQAGEAAELEVRQELLAHAEEIAQTLDGCCSTLTDDERGVNATVKTLSGLLGKITDHYPQARELAERMQSSYLELKDLAEECASRRDQIPIDPPQLEQITQRLDTIYALCQRHRLENADDLLALQQELDGKLQGIDHADQQIETLRAEIGRIEKEVTAQADKITAARQAAAPRIERHVSETLESLGIKQVQFRVQITPLERLSATGRDRISLLFSANAGSAPQPIEQVASGGELSRVMLSLKELIARNAQLPTIIFDEIDTGVSGRVADRMGEIIAAMGASMQVVNITHLPQVAAKGAHHYHVEKNEQRGTQIRKLAPDERLEQIAAMLSGSNVTEAARRQALELLKNH